MTSLPKILFSSDETASESELETNVKDSPVFRPKTSPKREEKRPQVDENKENRKKIDELLVYIRKTHESIVKTLKEGGDKEPCRKMHRELSTTITCVNKMLTSRKQALKQDNQSLQHDSQLDSQMVVTDSQMISDSQMTTDSQLSVPAASQQIFTNGLRRSAQKVLFQQKMLLKLLKVHKILAAKLKTTNREKVMSAKDSTKEIDSSQQTLSLIKNLTLKKSDQNSGCSSKSVTLPGLHGIKVQQKQQTNETKQSYLIQQNSRILQGKGENENEENIILMDEKRNIIEQNKTWQHTKENKNIVNDQKPDEKIANKQQEQQQKKQHQKQYQQQRQKHIIKQQLQEQKLKKQQRQELLENQMQEEKQQTLKKNQQQEAEKSPVVSLIKQHSTEINNLLKIHNQQECKQQQQVSNQQILLKQPTLLTGGSVNPVQQHAAITGNISQQIEVQTQQQFNHYQQQTNQQIQLLLPNQQKQTLVLSQQQVADILQQSPQHVGMPKTVKIKLPENKTVNNTNNSSKKTSMQTGNNVMKSQNNINIQNNNNVDMRSNMIMKNSDSAFSTNNITLNSKFSHQATGQHKKDVKIEKSPSKGSILKQMLQAGLMEPGENVLTFNFKGEHVYGALLDNGTIVTNAGFYSSTSDWMFAVRGVRLSKESSWRMTKYLGKPITTLLPKLRQHLQNVKINASKSLKPKTPITNHVATKALDTVDFTCQEQVDDFRPQSASSPKKHGEEITKKSGEEVASSSNCTFNALSSELMFSSQPVKRVMMYEPCEFVNCSELQLPSNFWQPGGFKNLKVDSAFLKIVGF